MVKYCNRPGGSGQLDIVLQLSVYIFVLLKMVHVSDTFMKFSMYNLYVSAIGPFRVIIRSAG